MNGSLTNPVWRLGVLVALGTAACDPVDHSVGAQTTNEAAYGLWGVSTIGTIGTSTTTTTTTTTGAAGATASAWSEDILRECRGGTPNVAPTCGSFSANPTKALYSMAIIVDQSLAMMEPLGDSGESRWDAVQKGLVNLYRDHDPLDGDSQLVLVFSNPPEVADSCQIGLTVISADTAADQLEALFQRNEPTGTLRPLGPGLSVAFNYYLEIDPLPPDMLLVLITAGAPDACAEVEPLEQLTAMASWNLTAIPDHRLPTYVIELGSETLDGVAEAGGTVQAASITEGDVAAQVEQALRNALGEVRFSEYCTFANPFGDDITDLPALIGPSYAPLEQEQVPLLDGPEACDASLEGGYYLLEDVPEPTFRYCPCSCARFARFGAQHTLTLPEQACMP